MEARVLPDEFSVLAFYGVSQAQSEHARFWGRVLSWLEEMRLVPDRIAVHGAGFSGRPVSFSRIEKRLTCESFLSIDSIHTYVMRAGGRLPLFDSRVSVDILRAKACVVVAVESSLLTLRDERLSQFGHFAVKILSPEYGIGFRRQRDKGPSLYATGITSGTLVLSGSAYEEALAISRWGDLGLPRRVYKGGLLRDVYPINFLTSAQLNAPIDGENLRSWIASSTSHGVLRQFEEEVSLWQLDEEEIPVVRERLAKSGRLFDWRGYVGACPPQ